MFLIFHHQSPVSYLAYYYGILENWQGKLETMVPSKGIYNLVDGLSPSRNLKRVQVECYDLDEWIHNILESLVTYGVPLKKISVKQANQSLESMLLFLLFMNAFLSSNILSICVLKGLIQICETI